MSVEIPSDSVLTNVFIDGYEVMATTDALQYGTLEIQGVIMSDDGQQEELQVRVVKMRPSDSYMGGNWSDAKGQVTIKRSNLTVRE
ncbi:hypothetical protein GGTG_04434 [Gaeumannomyces tritici R3-111a-1]|uniref:Uncharacterized protein n=1 Tax=Gaeumannomyces tritici (strain R3-111a-1) TaxID=644352 RepID=J3NT36_GAET3|nr:hypothetical protein GGTG_04434 [Gaeumannomyces tritici R3-111a-1]EJT79349.1 hypothetical protein GGTG_04434 [Gaeumannomyces tritici R3-111a-1]